MVVDDLHITRTRSSPGEADPPLVIDPNAHLPLAGALERLQSIPWGDPEIVQGSSDLELTQLPSRHLLNRPELPSPHTAGKRLGIPIRERDDHERIVTQNVNNVTHAVCGAQRFEATNLAHQGLDLS